MSGESFPELRAPSVLIALPFSFSFIAYKLSDSISSHLHQEACSTLSCIQSPCTTSQKMLEIRRCFQLVLSSTTQNAQIPHVLVIAKHHHKYLGYQCAIIITVNNLNTHAQLIMNTLQHEVLPDALLTRPPNIILDSWGPFSSMRATCRGPTTSMCSWLRPASLRRASLLPIPGSS